MWRCFRGARSRERATCDEDQPPLQRCTPAQPSSQCMQKFLDVSARLQEVFASAISGEQATDTWGTLQRAADIIAAAASGHISIHILSTSRRHVKVVRSQGMPTPPAVRPDWELSPIASFPSVLEVVLAGKQEFSQVPAHGGSHGASGSGRVPSADCAFLLGEGRCTMLTHVPLMSGSVAQGTLLIASGSGPHSATAHSLVSALWPMISMFLTDSNAVRLCSMLEKLQATNSIHSLAHTIVNDFNTWLEWCHSDDTEARLVLINDDKPQALVLHRSTAAFSGAEQLPPMPATMARTSSPRDKVTSAGNSLRRSEFTDDGVAATSPRSLSGRERPAPALLRVMHAAGTGSGKSRLCLSAEASVDSTDFHKQVLQDGLQGTQMSLLNTLTRRCIMDGSKLLFVPDVMTALRTYGEPWNDVFLDQAVVSNPTWAIAAPLKVKDRCVAAIIWLSHTRLSTTMLAHATRSTLVPLLHAMSLQLQQMTGRPRSDPLTASGPLSQPSFSSISDDQQQQQQQQQPMLSLFQQFVGSGLGAIKRINSNSAMLLSSSLQQQQPMSRAASAAAEDEASGTLSRLLAAAGTATGGPAASRNAAGAPGSAVGGTGVSSGCGGGEPPTPLVRFTVSRTDCASTQSLVRAYQTAIAQHQRTSTGANAEAFGQPEEIEIIAKVGQGAFGSVFVAMWKGQMVAVKVMKQAEGRKAMRMAWEMAVAQAVQHAHIITVHAVLMDVTVEKRGARTLRFNPFVPVQEVSLGSEHQLQADTDKEGPRCQVIIMEYCSLGPLHNYIVEKRFLGPGSFGPRRPPPKRSTADEQGDDALSALQRSRSCYGDPTAAVHSAPNLPLILSVLVDVASAMVYLQRNGFIHLDLKPENILLKVAQSESGFVAKVSDFGLSDLYTSEGPLIGEMGGTLTHLAPEIVTQRKATRACDVYSFGICMYELYTCQRPYTDVMQNMDRHTRDKEILKRVTEAGMRPQFPKGACAPFVALAQRCWAADPAQRPGFPEVLSELRAMFADEAAGGDSVCTPPSGNGPVGAGAPFTRHSSSSFTTAQRSGAGASAVGAERPLPIHRVPSTTLDSLRGGAPQRPSSAHGGCGVSSPRHMPAPVLE